MYSLILSTEASIEITEEQAKTIAEAMIDEDSIVIIENVLPPNEPEDSSEDIIVNVKHIVAIRDKTKNMKNILK